MKDMPARHHATRFHIIRISADYAIWILLQILLRRLEEMLVREGLEPVRIAQTLHGLANILMGMQFQKSSRLRQ